MREGGRLPAEALAKEGANARRRPEPAEGMVPEPVEGRNGATTLFIARTAESIDERCQYAQEIVWQRTPINRQSLLSGKGLPHFPEYRRVLCGSFPWIREGARGFRGRKGSTP